MYLIHNALKQMDTSSFTEYGTGIWCNLIEMSSYLLHDASILHGANGKITFSASSSNIWDNLVERSRKAQES